MDHANLTQLIADLDALVPTKGALIRVGGDDIYEEGEPLLVGNRAGYLRLGIELLRLADAQSSSRRSDRVLTDLSYLLDPTTNEGELATFERREDLRPWREEQEPGRGPARGPGSFIIPFVTVLVGALVLVGLYHSVKWLWDLLPR
jgi:hypothetical protein